MIRLNLEQGSPEWIAARLGIPTASRFDEILTPKTMKVSASAPGYLAELVAEWIVGHPVEEVSTDFMDRGKQYELDARSYYELVRECDVETVGFVMNDVRTCGCSPDGLIGTEGGLEIKTPSAKVHVEYMLGLKDAVKYKVQVQGGLWLAERQWWDFLSYHPEMPPVLVRYERDEPFIQSLAAVMGEFTEQLAAAKQRVRDMGITPASTLADAIREARAQDAAA